MSTKRFDGASFVDVSAHKRFDGSNWVDISSIKRYDGTNWIETLEQNIIFKRVAFNGPAVTEYGNASLTDTVSSDGKTYSFNSFGQQGVSRYIWLQAMGITVKNGDTITFTNVEFDNSNGSYTQAKTSPNTIYSTTETLYYYNSGGYSTITANSDGNLYIVFGANTGYTYTACDYFRIGTITINSKTYKDIKFSK